VTDESAPFSEVMLLPRDPTKKRAVMMKMLRLLLLKKERT
jgi:hypothetical protein